MAFVSSVSDTFPGQPTFRYVIRTPQTYVPSFRLQSQPLSAQLPQPTKSVITCKVHYLDSWLTLQRSITLFDLQLDAQNSCLFIYNIFIKILYMFRALPCSSSGGHCRNWICAASGIVTLCRWLSCASVKKELFLNRCTGQSPAETDDTRGCIYTVTK